MYRQWLRKNARSIVNAILALMFLGVFWFMYETISPLSEPFARNLESTLLPNTLIAALLLLAVGYIMYNFLVWIHTLLAKNPNWWVWSTTYCMIALFVFGAVFVTTQFGIAGTTLNLVLRDQSSKVVVGNISCSSSEGDLLADQFINCHIIPRLQNVTGQVTQYLEQGETVVQEFSNISFTSKSGTRRIMFEIQGINEYNESLRLEVGHNIKFMTVEENQKRNERFIVYLLGLLGLTIFSVPAMMVNFKELCK